jgi:hypothetical protein
MLTKYRERIKKVPLPVVYHLNQAVGALTTPHGTELYVILWA